MKYKLIAFPCVQGSLVHKGKLFHFFHYLLGVLLFYALSGHNRINGKIGVPFSSREKIHSSDGVWNRQKPIESQITFIISKQIIITALKLRHYIKIIEPFSPSYLQKSVIIFKLTEGRRICLVKWNIIFISPYVKCVKIIHTHHSAYYRSPYLHYFLVHFLFGSFSHIINYSFFHFHIFLLIAKKLVYGNAQKLGYRRQKRSVRITVHLPFRHRLG